MRRSLVGLLLVIVATCPDLLAQTGDSPGARVGNTGGERPGLFRLGTFYFTPYLHIGTLGIDSTAVVGSRCTINWSAPGPTRSTDRQISISPLVRRITPVTAKSIVSPFVAAARAARSEPGPLSSVVVTVRAEVRWLFVRHWDEWEDGTRSHLFAYRLADGRTTDLKKAMDADCPSRPFGGGEEYAVSPDGQEVGFAARDAGREEAWSTNFDLYRVPADGSARPANLTAANKAWDTQPAFSPDGKTLAYRAMARAGYEADRYRIVLRSWPDGKARILTEGWDRSPPGIVWSPDGREIYAVAENLGSDCL